MLHLQILRTGAWTLCLTSKQAGYKFVSKQLKNTQDCRGISCTIIDIHCISVGDGAKRYHLERPGWGVLGCT